MYEPQYLLAFKNRIDVEYKDVPTEGGFFLFVPV